MADTKNSSQNNKGKPLRHKTLKPSFELFDIYMNQIQHSHEYKREKQRIDYVLVHDDPKLEKEENPKCQNSAIRKCFESALKEEYDIVIKSEKIGKKVYKQLHCPFKSLCSIAQFVNLEMPIKGAVAETADPEAGCCGGFINKHLFDDETVDDYSGLFDMDRIILYKNHEDPSNFFRPAVRSFLLHQILINLDIKDRLSMDKSFLLNNVHDEGCCSCCGREKTLDELRNPEDPTVASLQKINLPFLRMRNIYTNTLILHEASSESKKEEDLEDTEDEDENEVDKEKAAVNETDDPRKVLNRTWPKFYKFQPLWRIRDYFGEKIALYFAWSGHLITSLWLPMIFGFAIFLFGLVKSIQKRVDLDSSSSSNSSVSDLLGTIKESFDNDITPFFAMLICIWGTLFLEFWKRQQARLSFQWDVNEFEVNEPDRPEFYGTTIEEVSHDPVDPEQTIMSYSAKRKAFKVFVSGLSLLFMVVLVLCSVVGVIVYRVFTVVDFCPSAPADQCLLVSTVVSSILNAVSILILGKLYELVAKKLTDWENHRTQTKYDDALIIKLFAFQFVNNYSSCFYIAFFRGRFDPFGVFGLGPEYKDECEGTCMSQLSFQILILMVTKPLPKLFSDNILPWMKRKWRNRPDWCLNKCCNCRLGKLTELEEKAEKDPKSLTFLEKQLLKEELGDFTLGEYTEKIIMYGFLMLFAASFPLAPFIALFVTLIDIRLDAKRLLWFYRRPLALIAQDIGTWYVILELMNFIGVVSNGFLIAFTSSWGNQFDIVTQLWIVIGFEHIVLCLKFIIRYLIPDVPADVSLKLRKKKHMMQSALDKLQIESLNVGSSMKYNFRNDGSEGDPDKEREWYPTMEPHRRVITYTRANPEPEGYVIEKPRQTGLPPLYADTDRQYRNYEETNYQTPVKKLKKRKKRRNEVSDLGEYTPGDYMEREFVDQVPVRMSEAKAHSPTQMDLERRDERGDVEYRGERSRRRRNDSNV